jgi:spermidine/putrescine-binding protein
MNPRKRRWRIIPLAALVVVAAAAVVATATARSSASTIRIAVLSDCQGAFG